MIPAFNESINIYLPYFFDDKVSVIFDKDLVETIILNGEQVSFNEFSSGEKMRFELSISISLFLLVKTFFSSSIGFIVFDEILDMNIDDEGIKGVLNIIDTLSESNSVIVISHRDQYKNYFQNKVYIYKDESGFSGIDQE
jgi:DNA repair exonuclease SbcCD ATPase subunit